MARATKKLAIRACAVSVMLTIVAGTAAISAPAYAAPAVQPAAAASNVVNDSNRTQVQQVFDGINKFRASKGLKPVKFYVSGSKVSQDWSTHMAANDWFDHNPQYSLDKRTPGWNAAGEIIAARWDRNGQGLVDQWIKSPPHNAAMSNPAFNVIGVGVAFTDGDYRTHPDRYSMYGTVNLYGYSTTPSGVYSSPNAYYSTLTAPKPALAKCATVAGTIASGKDLSRASIKSTGDYISVDTSGRLWRYPEQSNKTLGKRALIGNSGWQHARTTSVTDWNNDGYLDIVAHWSDGKVRVYKGKATGGFYGYLNAGSIAKSSTIVADRFCNNNPFPSIVEKTSAGVLNLYPNTKGDAFHPTPNKFNTGWSNYNLAIVDFDKDGKKDILGAQKYTGQLKLYRTNGRGTFISEARKVVGPSGWGTAATFTDTVGFGSGSAQGMIVKFRNGVVRYYELPKNGIASTKQIGYGFGKYNSFS
ncbi:FG-GAP-like repeat-containing protein [Arthrobacter crystallopoietes]|uniref:FG-GAP-like repeat-containing protein n=1 Tax=Crystallibacter crystallopoietes TaxID=37928 RepID=UPI0011144926|nr:FG-GAP-like repeat-containing protein [Arthrobacter crystallopoietes]